MSDAPARTYDLDVSVIIPALELTPHVLRIVTLLAQQEQDFNFEVLLVLNHEEREIEVELPPRARVLFCAKLGAFAARNVGIAAARGTVLAFTDSDVTPAAGWLKEGYETCKTTNFNMIVAGRVVPYYERRNAVAVYESAFYFQQEIYALYRDFAGTANLWVPVQIIERIGLFDADMLGAGDIEFCRRAARHGIKLIYGESIAVGHPARTGLRDLLTKERRLVGGEVLLSRSSPADNPSGLRGEFRGLLRRSQAIAKAHPMRRGLALQAVSVAVFAARIGERILVQAGKKPVPH